MPEAAAEAIERDDRLTASPDRTLDHAHARPQWLGVALAALGTWVASRVIYILVTYFSLVFAGNQTSASRTALLAWDIWDVTWYQHISRTGYFSDASTAFFPLYPMLVGAVTAVLGHGSGPIEPQQDVVRVVVGMAIANLGTLAAFIGLGLLALDESAELDPRRAARSILVLSAYPFAYYLAAGYAEGLFLAEAVFCLYFARRGIWSGAAVAAFLAGLTRPTGIALVLPLLWEFGSQHDWWRRPGWNWRSLALPAIFRGIIVSGAAPFGTALYAAFLWWRYGTPLIWLQVQDANWHRVAAPVWITGLRLMHRAVTGPIFAPAKASLFLQLLPLILLGVVVVFTFRKGPVSFSLYMISIAYLALAAPVVGDYSLIQSTGRYVLTAFPVFLVVSRWLRTRPSLETVWLGGGFAIQAILIGVFLRGGWVA